jgi:hypothetical protein
MRPLGYEGWRTSATPMEHRASPRGPAIDIFSNFGGGYYRRYRQHLPRGQPSTSFPTLVVAAARDTDNIPRGLAINIFFNFGGGCCQRYWQRLPRGQPSTSSLTSVMAAVEDTGSTHQGARHRLLLQIRWWMLPELPAPPPGGQPSIFD